jgi:shikimate dehydrogenase
MRCAVLGSPIAHSLSPAMHRAAYAELGLDWTYEAIELGEAALPAFLSALGDDVRGLSVTAPLKRVAARSADRRTEDVEMLGVANTLVIDDGLIVAANTDVGGVVAAIGERDLRRLRTARIVGGGATATSVAHALASMGVTHLEFMVREPSRAQGAADQASALGAEVTIRRIDQPMLDKVDLLVSTVPGDVIGSRSHELVESSRAVFDVVYDPWPTSLATAASEAKVPVISGLDLLAHQAALQVELMTGGTVSAQLLRKAALAELVAR